MRGSQTKKAEYFSAFFDSERVSGIDDNVFCRSIGCEKVHKKAVFSYAVLSISEKRDHEGITKKDGISAATLLVNFFFDANIFIVLCRVIFPLPCLPIKDISVYDVFFRSNYMNLIRPRFI